MYLAVRRLEDAFAKYKYSGDEKGLFSAIEKEGELWPFMMGADQLPAFVVGKALHDGSSYPSYRNIKRLFGRAGLHDIIARISRKLSRDAETLIEGFQSIRTALAHSSPPIITIADVEMRLKDAQDTGGGNRPSFLSSCDEPLVAASVGNYSELVAADYDPSLLGSKRSVAFKRAGAEAEMRAFEVTVPMIVTGSCVLRSWLKEDEKVLGVD